MTNFEKIKAMKIDELAEFIDKQAINDDFCINYCKYSGRGYECNFQIEDDRLLCAYDDLQTIKEWLESEVVE